MTSFEMDHICSRATPRKMPVSTHMGMKLGMLLGPTFKTREVNQIAETMLATYNRVRLVIVRRCVNYRERRAPLTLCTLLSFVD